MSLLKYLPAEILGLSVLVSAALTRIIFQDVSDFWFALVTALALFAIMQVRTHLVLDVQAKEKPSP